MHQGNLTCASKLKDLQAHLCCAAFNSSLHSPQRLDLFGGGDVIEQDFGARYYIIYALMHARYEAIWLQNRLKYITIFIVRFSEG